MPFYTGPIELPDKNNGNLNLKISQDLMPVLQSGYAVTVFYYGSANAAKSGPGMEDASLGVMINKSNDVYSVKLDPSYKYIGLGFRLDSGKKTSDVSSNAQDLVTISFENGPTYEYGIVAPHNYNAVSSVANMIYDQTNGDNGSFDLLYSAIFKETDSKSKYIINYQIDPSLLDNSTGKYQVSILTNSEYPLVQDKNTGLWNYQTDSSINLPITFDKNGHGTIDVSQYLEDNQSSDAKYYNFVLKLPLNSGIHDVINKLRSSNKNSSVLVSTSMSKDNDEIENSVATSFLNLANSDGDTEADIIDVENNKNQLISKPDVANVYLDDKPSYENTAKDSNNVHVKILANEIVNTQGTSIQGNPQAIIRDQAGNVLVNTELQLTTDNKIAHDNVLDLVIPRQLKSGEHLYVSVNDPIVQDGNIVQANIFPKTTMIIVRGIPTQKKNLQEYYAVDSTQVRPEDVLDNISGNIPTTAVYKWADKDGKEINEPAFDKNTSAWSGNVLISFPDQ